MHVTNYITSQLDVVFTGLVPVCPLPWFSGDDEREVRLDDGSRVAYRSLFARDGLELVVGLPGAFTPVCSTEMVWSHS